jgi:hypothetical protein
MHCGVELMTEGLPSGNPQHVSIRVIQHATDVCTRNLLKQLLELEQRKMRFG